MFGPNWEQVLMNQQLGYQALPEPDAHTDGIIPRAIQDIFSLVEREWETKGIKFNFFVSFVQIYNEKLFDLFQDKASKTPL
jgi:hypothetical protein